MIRARILDRYVVREFSRIFGVTALGFPLFTILIHLTDNIDKYLSRGIPARRIALAYLYTVPEQVFFITPAAVLFATVFSVGALSRHSEITAAKASGVSFHRLVSPIFLLAVLAAFLTFALGEVAPRANERKDELTGDREVRSQTARYNFVFRADGGRTYAIRSVSVPDSQMIDLQIEREGTGPEFPGYFLVASRGNWSREDGWKLMDGTLRLFMSNDHEIAFRFRELRQRALTERPADLLTQPKAPDQMTYAELGHYVRTLERSGNNANKLRVQQALKLAIPATCLIIALFGAPLGASGARSGTAYGVAVSLATTIVFLMLIQIAKAVGAGGVINPTLAAWLPNALFGLAGAVLFVRART